MPVALDPALVWNLFAALIVGALVGVEREKTKAQSGNLGIGGVRTFILFALAGAVGGWLATTLQSAWVLVAAVGSVTALAVSGYLMQARVKPDALGLTTETAAVAVCLLGAACTAGHAAVALALGIAVSGVLAYKEPMHGLVAKLGADDISAGVKLLAATFIVLPLLPARAIDPWGAIRPQALWTLVVAIAAISLVGYVATRMLGPDRGTAVTGLTGGLVSSTAVTLTFARRSREEGAGAANALAAGLLLAWTVMSARVVVLAGLVHAPLVRPLLVPFGAMAAATLVPVALLLRRRGDAPAEAGRPVELRNPFSLTSAVKFGLLFAVVLLVVALVRRYFPGQGYYVVAALAGLTDVDAITLSMAGLVRDGGADAATATGAIVIAALANTLVKCGIIVGTAAAALRARVVVVTLLLVASALASLWIA
ncbi:MAG: DUF4010 domain-containing protein [Vicinamibacteria bacterium]